MGVKGTVSTQPPMWDINMSWGLWSGQQHEQGRDKLGPCLTAVRVSPSETQEDTVCWIGITVVSIWSSI